MKNKRTVLAIIVASASVVFSVLGFVLLPERVTVNLSFNDTLSYMNKYVAVFFPLAISLCTVGLYNGYGRIFGKQIDKSDFKSGIKYLAFSIVGLLLTLWVIIRNI